MLNLVLGVGGLFPPSNLQNFSLWPHQLEVKNLGHRNLADFKRTKIQNCTAISQSEVLAKCLREIGEKCSEILAKAFAAFRPSICRENGRHAFHEKSSTFSAVHQIKFFLFSLLQLWGPWGPKVQNCTRPEFRRKRDLYEPVLTTMAQVPPFLERAGSKTSVPRDPQLVVIPNLG